VAVLCDVRGKIGFELEQEVFIVGRFSFLAKEEAAKRSRRRRATVILFIENSRAAAGRIGYRRR